MKMTSAGDLQTGVGKGAEWATPRVVKFGRQAGASVRVHAKSSVCDFLRKSCQRGCRHEVSAPPEQ